MNLKNNKQSIEVLNLDDDCFFNDDIIIRTDDDIEILDIDNEKTDDIEILDIDNEKINDIEILEIQDINFKNSIEILNIDDNLLVKKNECSDGKSYHRESKNDLNSIYGTKNNKKIQKIILIILLFIIILGIIFSVYKIIRWQLDNNSINEQLTQILENTVIEEKEDNDNTVIIENNVIESDNENNDYYRFIQVPLINVDLSELKKQNNDTIGWIQVNGTNINYPVVKTVNNSFYLNHDFNQDYNDGGWIFVDYRNNLIDDKNLIIYGHARLNSTMFGTLKNVIKSNWYTNVNNHVIRVSTINTNMSYQVFSTYVTDAEDYYIKTDFNNDEEYLQFLNEIKLRSVYNYDVNLNETDRIITLSTCYTNNQRVVLHAKLIKYENR